MNIFKTRLIQNLKHYRKLRHLTQEGLARACKLSTNYIAEIEIGRKFPSANTMIKFATALDIPPPKICLNPYKSLAA